MLDIGIIVPELSKYGGAERVVLECAVRWKDRHQITLYSSTFNEPILDEHGICERVKRKIVSPYFVGKHATVLNGTILPKLWEAQMGNHQVYLAHLWPTHLIDLHPIVWYPHEPLRMLYDLRFNQPIHSDEDRETLDFHAYPKQQYEEIDTQYLDATLSVIQMFDHLGQPDRIVANSQYTCENLRSIYDHEVSNVVYPGVDAEDFLDMPPHENMFLTVGQLWPHKRTGLIIEAIKLVESCQLYIVGNGPERAKLVDMAEQLGVSDRVFFLDSVSHKGLRLLYARCLASVFTPIREPFGIVVLESMAAGRPVIAANEGGYTEVVDENCALLVPPEPQAIARQMSRLIQDKELATTMGAHGAELAKSYSWDRTATEIEDILIEVCQKSGTTASIDSSWSRDKQTPLVGAHYFCWYGSGYGAAHWNDNLQYGAVTDTPLLGYYPSSHGTTIERHMEMCSAINLDFLILNLHVDKYGVNQYELKTIEHWFKIAAQNDSTMRFAIQLCLYQCDSQHLSQIIEDIRNRFCPNAHYLKHNSQPVLFVFWTGAYDYDRGWIETFRPQTDGLVRIACSLRPYTARTEHRKTFGLFEGWSFFSPLELAGPMSKSKLWKNAYDNFDAGSMQLKIFTVSPGYDDRGLEDPQRARSRIRRIPRRNGNTYEQMIDSLLGLDTSPDMVVISTFNEFHENTHIEPSRQFETKYMDMTRQMIQSIRMRSIE